MNTPKQSKNQGRWQRLAAISAAAVLTLTLAGCGVMTMMHGGAKPPAESEFGLGPRTSAQGQYTATLQPEQPLKPRRMQSIQVRITDPAGQPVEGATIAVDGGMPQHGHGLPTRPRVTKYLGDGVYAIDGVRFNMGGWWEFKLAVTTPAAADTVTFNLSL
jgi:hypothetical protein